MQSAKSLFVAENANLITEIGGAGLESLHKGVDYNVL
jgi:hypothetical protein